MNKEIFERLQGMENESEAILEAARQYAQNLQAETLVQGEKIQEKLLSKLEVLHRTKEKESALEFEHLREEAAQKLREEQAKLDEKAKAQFPQAVLTVLKECLANGHR